MFLDLTSLNFPYSDSDKTWVLLRSIPESIPSIFVMNDQAMVLDANEMDNSICAPLKEGIERRKAYNKTIRK